MQLLTKESLYVLFLILGLSTYIISWNIDSSIATSTCKSSALKTSIKLLITISSLLVAISLLSLLGCDLSTHNKLIYSLITILLGILLIILGIIIVINSGSSSSCSQTRGEGAIWIIVFGIIVIGGASIVFLN